MAGYRTMERFKQMGVDKRSARLWQAADVLALGLLGLIVVSLWAWLTK
jgi:hypothetical protein